MQKLIFTETPYNNGQRKIQLPIPEVDPQWNYYEDVAVIAIPSDSVSTIGRIMDLSEHFNP